MKANIMQLRITGIDTDTCVRQSLQFGLLKQNVDFITIFYKQREMGKYVQSEIMTSCGQLTNTFPEDNDNQNNFQYNTGIDGVT